MLYHGSNIEIYAIRLEKCAPFKDFGKGFLYNPFPENGGLAWLRTRKIL